MNFPKLIVVLIAASTLMTSCVSTKKYNALDANLKKLEADKNEYETKIAKNQVSLKKLNDQVKDLQTQLDDSKQKLDAQAAAADNKNGGCGQLVGTLKDMGVLSPAQASSLEQSMQSMGGVTGKEALNATLVNNLKAAIGGASDTDVVITSDKGFLYVDLTDHMFFNSGSAEINKHAKMVLEKIAKMLNANPDLQFMIEGHTDNQPMHGGCMADNWDLSIKRSTEVVRLLQKHFGVNPARMVAAGHGEYAPVAANDTPAHRAQNRRITIVMMPQLDQFFKLLVKK